MQDLVSRGETSPWGTKHMQKHPSCKRPLYMYAISVHSPLRRRRRRCRPTPYINHHNYEMNGPLQPISVPCCINEQLDRTQHLITLSSSNLQHDARTWPETGDEAICYKPEGPGSRPDDVTAVYQFT
jgi:hypothetical protein